MEKEMNAKNLKTQAAYARLKGISRARVNQMINEKKLTVVWIDGSKLIWVPDDKL
jgi:hypothetical protein